VPGGRAGGGGPLAAQHPAAPRDRAPGPAQLAERGRVSGLEGAALVTGGSMGIGRAIAAELARRGMRVAVTARDAGALHAAAAEIPALAVAGDVTRADAVRRMVETAERELGPLELIV